MIHLAKKPIYFITEGKLTPQNFHTQLDSVVQIIEKAVEYEIDLIQIREKNLTSNLLLNLAEIAVKIASNSKTKVLINERFDIALIVKADGVHLTSTSIPVETVRKLVPDKFIVGVSVHSPNEIADAKKNHADFVTFSPIFRKYLVGEPIGIKAFSETATRFQPFPIVALGGINESNFREVLNKGFGIASIGFLNKIENLKLIELFRHKN
jgi:thiamine-phosphate pyrophosphorylase